MPEKRGDGISMIIKPSGEPPLRRPGGPLEERENVIYVLIDSAMDKVYLDNINQELKSWTEDLKNHMPGSMRVMRIATESKWINEMCSLDEFVWTDVNSGDNADLRKAISLLMEDLKVTSETKWRRRPSSVLLFYGSNCVTDHKEVVEFDKIEYVNRYVFLMNSKVEKEKFVDFVNHDSNIVNIEGKFGIAFHKIINHSCAFSGYDIGEPIKDARDQIHFVYGGPPYEAIFRIEDEKVIVRKYGLDNSETNVIEDILEQFPDIWRDKKRFQSILMDFLPDNRLLRNLIMGCISEGIVADIVLSKGYKKNEIQVLTKRLSNAFGCQKGISEQIVWNWVVGLKKSIIEQPVSIDITTDLKDIDYGTNDWTNWE